MLNHSTHIASPKMVSCLYSLSWVNLCTSTPRTGKANSSVAASNEYFTQSIHSGFKEVINWGHEWLFLPECINNVHALNYIHEPRLYIIIMIWWQTILHTPLFYRFIPSIFQKYKKSHHFYCQFSHFLDHKSYHKLDDLIGMCHLKRWALCVCIRLGA